MKKNKLSRIGADINSCHAVCVVASAALPGSVRLAAATGSSRTIISTAATASPNRPAPMKAPRQPHRFCMIKRLAGVTAEPSRPANVWIE